jgi:hypothetical protein
MLSMCVSRRINWQCKISLYFEESMGSKEQHEHVSFSFYSLHVHICSSHLISSHLISMSSHPISMSSHLISSHLISSHLISSQCQYLLISDMVCFVFFPFCVKMTMSMSMLRKWNYLVLDEAHHIKNFKSRRWQILLKFPSAHRLLLTGTPIQNSLVELWSLMHFLMPHMFESHSEFREWFEIGIETKDEDTIRRLHSILGPFMLRRLKCEVEKELPLKYAHTVACPLSRRQKFLYEDFISRSETKSSLQRFVLIYS